MELTHDINKHKNIRALPLIDDKREAREPGRLEDQNNAKSKANFKDNYLNNAFYEEGQHDQAIIQKVRVPFIRHEDDWIEKVLERERKAKREETNLAHERLKMIEKRTHYTDRNFLSPSTRAKLPEPVIMPRSASKREIIEVEDRAHEMEKGEKLATKRLTPRSLSRKDLSPVNARISARSPLHRQTISPFKVNNY
jgi:hypothetical protein